MTSSHEEIEAIGKKIDGLEDFVGDREFTGKFSSYESVIANLKVAQIRAALLQAAEMKRIADALELIARTLDSPYFNSQ